MSNATYACTVKLSNTCTHFWLPIVFRKHIDTTSHNKQFIHFKWTWIVNCNLAFFLCGSSNIGLVLFLEKSSFGSINGNLETKGWIRSTRDIICGTYNILTCWINILYSKNELFVCFSYYLELNWQFSNFIEANWGYILCTNIVVVI